MRRPFRLFALLMSTLLVTGIASAEPKSTSGAASGAEREVKIDPGLWQVTKISTAALVKQVSKDVQMECLTENPFTPERVAGNYKGCEIEKTFSSDDEVSWKMVCKGPVGSVVATGSFKSEGSTAQGEMKTTMTVGKQALETHTKWEGIRLGECGMELPKKPVKRAGKKASGS